MDESVVMLQIAFKIVENSPDWFGMSVGGRLEEVRRVYEKLEAIIDGIPLDKSEMN